MGLSNGDYAMAKENLNGSSDTSLDDVWKEAGEQSGNNDSQNIDYEKKLNEIVQNMEYDEKTETYKLPDNIPPELQLAAKAEKRRRDLQSRLDKTSYELEKLKKIKEELASQVSYNLDLTQEQKEELEELKLVDPEAWRKKVNALENEAKNKIQEELNEKEQKISAELEKERRVKILESFLAENPDIETDSLYDDVPYRLRNALDKGEIEFEDYLEEAKKYLSSTNEPEEKNKPGFVNLDKAGGSNSLPDVNIEADIISSYNNEVY